MSIFEAQHNHAQYLKVKHFGRPLENQTSPYKRLAATKASKVWFSYSHNCYAKSDCPMTRQNLSVLATAHGCETGLMPKRQSKSFTLM